MPKGIYIRTKEHRKNLSLLHKGKIVSKETKRKLSIATKNSWQNPEYRRKNKTNKGKRFSEEVKKKVSLASKKMWQNPKIRKEIMNNLKKGKDNSNWKGNKVGNKAIHRWVRRYKSKLELCEKCHKRKDKNGSIKLELANIRNHKYTRNFEDWKWFHHSCHAKFDLIQRGKNVF